MKSKINIKKMTCNSCVRIIEKKVSRLKGVKNIEVDLLKEQAEVEFDSKKIRLAEIEQEIVDAGYAIQGKKAKHKNFLEAAAYALIPHVGCIAFVFASIFGATLMMQFFKPLLMSRYFFHALIGVSFGFATLSALIYLRREGFLSMVGIKRKWKYLFTMYGTTIGINLLLFLLIFPMLANVSATEGSSAYSDSTVVFSVDIPCSGHAPLISEELKAIEGVNDIRYSFPRNFEVSFDSAKTSKDEMMALAVFDEYPAELVSSDSVDIASQDGPESCGVAPGNQACAPNLDTEAAGAGSCGADPAECTGSCGGSCGSCSGGCGLV